MKSKIKTNNSILLIISVLSLTFLLFILYQVNTDVAEAFNVEKLGFNTLDYFIGFGYIFVLIFHFYAILFLFDHFHRFEELKALRTVLLILGVISLLAIGGEKVLADEIAREYRFGMEMSEIYVLFVAILINLSFNILMILFVLKTFKLKGFQSTSIPVDEKIFTIAQCLGIFSGLMGLLLTFDLIGKKILTQKLWIYIPFYILFLVPYILVVIYWLSLKLKQRMDDWFDEKQLQDLRKSSLTTLFISFPGLALFLFMSLPSHFYFFLYYIFLVLFLFSASTLYFFRFKDSD